MSFTKVVARTVQFLSDNRDDEHLIDGVDVPEEEERNWRTLQKLDPPCDVRGYSSLEN